MLKKYYMVINMVKKLNKLYVFIFTVVNLVVSNINAFAQNSNSIVSNIDDYSFVVAGHAYGAHTGTNLGLYPKFLEKIKKDTNNFDFFVFTGDIIRGNNQNWKILVNELNNFEKPYWFVMGNNDNSSIAREIFKNKYGNTFYKFVIKNELFIVLDTQIDEYKITEDQLLFTKKAISENDTIKNVFIFFSELLWNQDIKYKELKSNKPSRYKNIQKSNFWTDFYPILKQYKNKQFYIIAGDVAGNIDAIPAFYEKNGNITLIASGMGEVKDENYLLVNVNDTISFKLIALNKNVNLDNIKNYDLETMSSYYNPSTEVVIEKFKNNITHIQFKRGFFVASILFLLIIVIFQFIKFKMKK